MKIVFFGTSEVGLPILEALLKDHEVIHVVTSPDKPVGRNQVMTESVVANFAAKHNLAVSKPEKVKNNPEFLDFLRRLQADIFIVVSYGKILPAELLDVPPLKTINVHFSLLPKYRGAAPIQFALLNGETTTGTTIFILDEQVDHGPILAQQEIAIASNDNFVTLAEKLSEISADLLLDILPKYQNGTITPQEQDHFQATATGMIKKEQARIDFTSMPAQKIHNMWRAFTPWPGIWTTYEGQVLKILDCEVVNDAILHSPDAPANHKDIIPCAGQTYLRLKQVQLAGKSAVSMRDFLNGHQDFTPASLGQ